MSRTLQSHVNPASPTTRDVQGTANSAKAMRIPGLDFTKGTLVLFMVLYHWLNYFVGAQWPYYRYLRFLTPSFIFITGFMISNVYLSKYEPGDSRLVKRLFTRGFKLIAIFVVLNILRDCLVPGGLMLSNLLDSKNLLATFVTGTFTSKVVAFYILVPIAYLLMLSGILMALLRVWRYVFHATCLCLFALIAILDLRGESNQNVEMVAIGMLGVLAGFSSIAVVNKVVRHPYMLAASYLLYAMAITIWNVPYPLEVVGTFLSITIIYLIGTIDSKATWIRDEIILLGKYSLFGYISQIVVLQILAATLRHLNLRSTAAIISFPAGFALSIIAVEVIHRARMRAVSIDRLYRAVFN